jgi:Yqey-like protein
LAYTYKVLIVERKQFSEKNRIAAEMEAEFLRQYFGENTTIQNFAQYLLLNGYRAAARELNEVARVFGNDIDVFLVKRRICNEYGIRDSGSSTPPSYPRNDPAKPLRERIAGDIRDAEFAGDRVRVDALRVIEDALICSVLEARGVGRAPIEDDLLTILERLKTSRQAAIKTYADLGLPGYAEKLISEIAVLDWYLAN